MRILASIAKEAEYTALVGQHVPQLGLRRRRRAGEVITEAARLAVVCSCHSVAPDRLYDVSIRNAISARALAKGSARQPAVATDIACADKARRYPPRGGCEVFCFAMETAGRFHPSADEELRRLACLASDRCIERGIRPAASMRRWRHQLQAALMRSIAAAFLSKAAETGQDHEPRELSEGEGDA